MDYKNNPKKQSKSSSKDTLNSYNKMSNWYDLFAGFERKYREIGLNLLKSEFEIKTLEIGFGTGHSLVSLAKTATLNGQIFGIDFSDGMCKKTKNLMKKKKVADKIFITCADATVIPFRDEVFDQLFISFTLELFDFIDIPNVLANCSRILKKDGKICIVSLSRRKTNFMVKIYEWLHKKFPKIIDCKPIITEKFLLENNFQILKIIHKMMWGLPVDIILAKK